MSDESRAWKDQYMLRFPEGMRERLKREAAKNKRSLNAEIIARLDQSLGNSGLFRNLHNRFENATVEDLDFAQNEAAKILESLQKLAAMQGVQLQEIVERRSETESLEDDE